MTLRRWTVSPMDVATMRAYCLTKPGAWSDEWLDRYPTAARVMAYLGRSGWNDLDDDVIPDDELREAVDESYRLVVAKLPRKHRPDGWDA